MPVQMWILWHHLGQQLYFCARQYLPVIGRGRISPEISANNKALSRKSSMGGKSVQVGRKLELSAWWRLLVSTLAVVPMSSQADEPQGGSHGEGASICCVNWEPQDSALWSFCTPTCKLQCLWMGVGSHVNEKMLQLTKSASEKNRDLGTKDCAEVLTNNGKGERAVLIPRDF